MTKLWQGSFLTGATGYNFVAGTVDRVDSEILRKVNSELGECYLEFSPWMSTNKYLDEFKNLESLTLDRELFLDRLSLEKLSRIISSEENRDLYKVHYESDGNIGVCLSSDKEFLGDYKALQNALQLIKTNDFEYYLRFKKVVNQVILQTATGGTQIRQDGTGLSSFNYRKGIFLSIPRGVNIEVELLLNIAHEFGHQCLINLQHIDRIIMESHFKLVFSVIRKVKRPSILSFHALIASVFMLEFIIRNNDLLVELSSNDYIKSRKNEVLKDVEKGIKILKTCSLTPLGKNILDECLGLYIFAS